MEKGIRFREDGVCQVLMLEKYSMSNVDTFCVEYPYFVAAIVFPSVPEIETGDGVFFPCFVFIGHGVEFNCASERSPRILVKIM